MNNWQALGNSIANSTSFSNNHILNNAHMTTKHRLEAAQLHLLTLNSTRCQPITHPISFLSRAMLENIFSGLAGSLDSLGHEINQVYAFGIDVKRVQIDHFRIQQKNETNCIRCKLDSLHNDSLSCYLNAELPRAPIPQNHWYYAFGMYRQQINHRPWLLLHLAAEGIFLPDDPTVSDPVVKPYYDSHVHQIVYPNYREGREIRSYCKLCLQKVLEIVENAYSYLRTKI
jgi:hypothetical protein